MNETDAIAVLEIVDTAVKIGLGGLIGGVAAYFLAKLHHRQDIEKDSLKRKRELLEKVANDIENSWNTYRRYYLVSLEYIHRLKINEDMPNGMKSEFNEKRKAVTESTDHLSSAISILLLLGENLVYEEVIKYAEKSQEYMTRTSDPETSPEINKLKIMHNDVIDSKDDIFKKLSISYSTMGF